MAVVFYVSAFIAVVSTFMVITRVNGIHALLYLIVSLLSVAIVFFLLGAPLVAALEVIIYAGAIMVLFLFIIMLLGQGHQATRDEEWLRPRAWIGPAILATILLLELVYVIGSNGGQAATRGEIAPKQVAIDLYGPYLLAVELASMLLLAGLVGAYHLGRPDKPERPS